MAVLLHVSPRFSMVDVRDMRVGDSEVVRDFLELLSGVASRSNLSDVRVRQPRTRMSCTGPTVPVCGAAQVYSVRHVLQVARSIVELVIVAVVDFVTCRTRPQECGGNEYVSPREGALVVRGQTDLVVAIVRDPSNDHALVAGAPNHPCVGHFVFGVRDTLLPGGHHVSLGGATW